MRCMRAACSCIIAEVVALALRIELELAHRLEEADQHGERRAQLVRHVGDEVAPHGVDALGLRDVAREQQLLRLWPKGMSCSDSAMPFAAGDAHRRSSCGLARYSTNSGSRTRLAMFWPRSARPSSMQLALGGAVAPLDAVRAVEDHHAVGQRLHGAPHARERVGEAASRLRRVALEAVQAASTSSQMPSPSGTWPGSGMREPALQAREVACMPEKQRDEAGGECPSPMPGRRAAPASETGAKPPVQKQGVRR